MLLYSCCWRCCLARKHNFQYCQQTTSQSSQAKEGPNKKLSPSHLALVIHPVATKLPPAYRKSIKFVFSQRAMATKRKKQAFASCRCCCCCVSYKRNTNWRRPNKRVHFCPTGSFDFYATPRQQEKQGLQDVRKSAGCHALQLRESPHFRSSHAQS